MAAVFKVESENINDLDALQLTKLLKLLLHLEARSVDVALNITVADGGEDGRIEWSNGPENTDYLPGRLVQFQCKATNMGPADCANEIIGSSGSVKPMIDDVLTKGGVYVLFTTQELNKSQKGERTKAIREKLVQLGRPYANTAVLSTHINKYDDVLYLQK